MTPAAQPNLQGGCSYLKNSEPRFLPNMFLTEWTGIDCIAILASPVFTIRTLAWIRSGRFTRYSHGSL